LLLLLRRDSGPAIRLTDTRAFWLTDAQKSRLGSFFPKDHGRPRVDGRCVLRWIIVINHNGLRCCDAPKEYWPLKTLYTR
jgi:hypothetical protein